MHRSNKCTLFYAHTVLALRYANINQFIRLFLYVGQFRTQAEYKRHRLAIYSLRSILTFPNRKDQNLFSSLNHLKVEFNTAETYMFIQETSVLFSMRTSTSEPMNLWKHCKLHDQPLKELELAQSNIIALRKKKYFLFCSKPKMLKSFGYNY